MWMFLISQLWRLVDVHTCALDLKRQNDTNAVVDHYVGRAHEVLMLRGNGGNSP